MERLEKMTTRPGLGSSSRLSAENLAGEQRAILSGLDLASWLP